MVASQRAKYSSNVFLSHTRHWPNKKEVEVKSVMLFKPVYQLVFVTKHGRMFGHLHLNDEE